MTFETFTGRYSAWRLLAFLSVCSMMTLSLKAQNLIPRPVRPAELLKCLPPAEKSWRITVSNADHLKQNPPKSRATREYTYARDASETSVGPKVVQITLVDTCASYELVSLYAEPKAGQPDEGRGGSRFRLDGMPATRIHSQGQPDTVEVLALDRFIVRISVPEKENAEQWVRKIDFKMLKRLAEASGTINQLRSYSFTFERVDEINPKKNKSINAAVAGLRPDDE